MCSISYPRGLKFIQNLTIGNQVVGHLRVCGSGQDLLGLYNMLVASILKCRKMERGKTVYSTEVYSGIYTFPENNG
jgi:hypothetical protein